MSIGDRLSMLLIYCILINFSLTVKTATLIFISGRGAAISSAEQGKSGGELISCLGRTNVCAFHENSNVYTLNSLLLTFKAQNHKMYVFVVKPHRQTVRAKIY